MDNTFHIACDVDGARLDVFLAEKLSITRTKVKEMVEGGHVRIDGKTVKPSLKTKKGMIADGVIPEEAPLSLEPEAIPLDILYEDEYFIAINKAAGMVVHPSFGHSSGTLVNAVLSYLGHEAWQNEQDPSKLETRNSKLETVFNVRPGIVHRLDKGTTGVILIAKDPKTQQMLSDLFKERDMKKTYRAIVEGVPPREQWLTEGNIGRHPVERKKMAVLKSGGREAATTFKVLRRMAGFAYVEAYPKTGRTHQIRVHLAHAGHPIVGDETYGKKAKNMAERPLLHAFRIEFIHPVTSAPVSIEAPVPDDMEQFVRSA